MSYIIEQLGQEKELLSTSIFFKPNQSDQMLKLSKISQSKIKNNLLSLSLPQTGKLLQYNYNSEGYILRYAIQNIITDISAIITLKYSSKTQQIKSYAKLINNDRIYTLVNSKERRKYVARYLAFNINPFPFCDFKLCVHIQNGQIIIESPTLHKIDSEHRSIQNLYSTSNKLIKNYLRTIQESLISLFEFTNENSKITAFSIAKRSYADKNIVNIGKYIKVSSSSLCIQSDGVSEEVMQTRRKRQQISFRKIRSNIVNQKIKDVSFYHVNPQQIQNYSNIDYQLLQMQKKIIIKKIEMPPVPKSSNPHQNNFILNFIKRKHSFDRIPIQKKIGAGGFASILIMDIQYFYIASHKMDLDPDSWQITSPLFKKQLALKRQDPSVIKSGMKSRIVHEKNILTKIKFGVSPFLPKFYIISDKKDQLQPDLLMDFIGYPTLGDFSKGHKETISIMTRMALIYNLAQGLRSLKQFNIVHLDIKPSNIMLGKKNITKLIDFGESYHPDIKDHHPGLSMPFSAPENYKSSQFTQKNDVFSVGVILHMLAMGQRCPYYVYSERDRDEVYRNENTFYDRWFFCEEGNNYYGQTNLFALLQLIIARCMNKNPNFRPDVEWIVYLMRQCIDSLC